MSEHVTILIPASNPPEQLIGYVNELASKGHFKHILIVNDGSRQDCRPIFDVLSNSKAMGL